MSRKEETRAKILKSALKLFSEVGYYQATTKQIADYAGINEITLFRHFGTKEHLFQATTENYVTELELMNEINDLINDDFEDTIIKLSKDYLDYCKENKKLYKIQMRLGDSEKEFVKLKLSRNFAFVLNQYFNELKKENKINGNPEKMSIVLIEAILGAFTINVLTNGTFTDIPIEELVEEHARQFSQYYKID